LSEENREYRPKQRMNVGRMERIGWLERGSGKMSKRPKPFEYKGKKKTRLPRESLWRDGFVFSKWWRRGELNPRPKIFRLSLYIHIPNFDFRPQIPLRAG
jgi:hypothetical protein